MEKNKINIIKNNISSKVYKDKDKMSTKSAMPSNANKESTPAATGINSTEKLKKQLQDIKENRKQKEKVIKPAVRIQELKNKLIILAHDLFVKKNINAALYRKMQLLTYSRTTENKLNESYNILNNIKKELGKSNELKIKTKKSTVKDFNIENKNVKESKDNNKLKKYDNNKYYQGFINDTLDNIYFHFYNHIKDEYLTETSEQYLKIKNYKKGANKDYIPTEKTEHTSNS